MQPYKLKQQRLKLLAHTERQANMKTGNGAPPKQLTPEQLVAQAAQQRMMQVAYNAQQRQGMATSLLSGILSGLYSNVEQINDETIDAAIDDVLVITDKLHGRLTADAQNALKANAPQPAAPQPDAPGGDQPPEKPASGQPEISKDTPQPGAEQPTGSGTAVEPQPDAPLPGEATQTKPEQQTN